MALPFTTLIRKIMLIGNGLIFLGIAVYGVFAAKKAAFIYGFTLNGLDGLNEYRAVFIGFWIGLTVLFFAAARRVEQPLLGDIGFLMILLQAMGRLLSFVLDGIPGPLFVIFFFGETTVSVIGLLLRPKPSASGT